MATFIAKILFDCNMKSIQIKHSMTNVCIEKCVKEGPLVVNMVDNDALSTACDSLKRGGVVALPTDTIYGKSKTNVR